MDNAILLFDWFTVFRLAANIPTFDLMCKLLQQMALGIKGFFSVVRQVSSTKKLHEPEKKRKFNEQSIEEVQEITDDSVPVKTKKAIKFGMRIFNGT